MVRWAIGKEHPLRDGGKFVPLAKHEGMMFGRRQLGPRRDWEAHTYPEDTEEVLNIPVPNKVWYVNIGVDLIGGQYAILTNPNLDRAKANRDRAAYERDHGGAGGYVFHKQVVFAADGDVEDPNVWNKAVKGVIDLLRVNGDLTEDREDLIESLLREQA